MKQILLSLAAVAALSTSANAACFADYKAKRDDPLRLHYGVIQIDGACTAEAAHVEIDAKLSDDGWTLLTVLSVFDDAGLVGREQSAGEYYLRY